MQGQTSPFARQRSDAMFMPAGMPEIIPQVGPGSKQKLSGKQEKPSAISLLLLVDDLLEIESLNTKQKKL